MSFHWGEHVGELELRIAAPDEVGVLACALAAVGELLGDGDGGVGERRRGDRGEGEVPEGDRGEGRRVEGDRGGDDSWRTVQAAGADRASLLAAWLEELFYLGESEGFVPVEAAEMELGERDVRARVRGYIGAPAHLVKAVTYHRLSFARAGQGWEATAVLDV